ncbi:MAG TPA: ABC transporter ATP-binding protein, partial [Armatimonadota bacterium]|nr:ABC transporter ATP-binding protein [Armatimonadota bacterium]
GNLDYETGVRVLSAMVDLTRAGHITLIMVTHNSVMAEIADRVIHMRSGAITQVEENAAPQDPRSLVW